MNSSTLTLFSSGETTYIYKFNLEVLLLKVDMGLPQFALYMK